MSSTCGNFIIESGVGNIYTFISPTYSGSTKMNGYTLENISICYPNGKCTEKEFGICICYCGETCDNENIQLWPTISINASCSVITNVLTPSLYNINLGLSTPAIQFTFTFTGNFNWMVDSTTILNLNLADLPAIIIDNNNYTTLSYQIYTTSFTYSDDGLVSDCKVIINVNFCPNDISNPITLQFNSSISQNYDGITYSANESLNIPIVSLS